MTSSATPIIEIKDLCVRYGPALALHEVSLSITEGTCIAVLGPNGAGKSTLARVLSGLVPAASGTILFEGEDVTRTAPYLMRRTGLVYLPEGRGIFPALTVNENLRMASTLLPRAERKAALERGFEVFPELTKRRGLKAGSLSGGEQQMLSLCRGLILSPKLVIADEMSLGLAPKLVEMVFESIERLKQTGATVVLIEQFVHRALAAADYAALLLRGQIAWQGPAASAKEEVLSRYLGGTAAAAAS
jgi:branched-chain amino acid transport system ATP-binding protein